MKATLKLGFVPAHRRFFSVEMAARMREQTLSAMASAGIEVVVPDDSMTEAGCVRNRREGRLCGELFRREGVDGIVIGAMNFGDEQGCAQAVISAGASVPIFLFGCQEEEPLRTGLRRKDAFCGLLSIAEALRQLGIPYTTAQTPITFPADPSFRTELDHFVRICRVLKGIRGARIGQIGPRPEAFWSVRVDEKALQRLGITVVPRDLSEVLAAIGRLEDGDPIVLEKLRDLRRFADASSLSDEELLRLARFERVLDEWIEEQELDAIALQCWSSLQLNYGIVPCAILARYGDRGFAAACESDVLGALSMLALRLAADSPPALLDWNNLHNEDTELVNLWHCGVYPPSYASTRPVLGVQDRMARNIGRDVAVGALHLTVKPGPGTLFRIAQDAENRWKCFIAQGQFEDNPATTAGGLGWFRLPGLPRIYREILLEHFPHHVAVTRSRVGNVLYEAFGKYLRMDVYHGEQIVPGRYLPRLPFPFEIPEETHDAQTEGNDA